MMDYRKFFSYAMHDAIERVQKERAAWHQRPSAAPFIEALASVADIKTDFFDGYSDVVRIGRANEINPAQRERLIAALKTMVPWRKGPFEVFGVPIDAEWQSYKKWDRLLPEMPSLSGKVVADVGCNNGYYMFRMLAQDPKRIIGFDPTLRFYYAYKMLAGFLGIDNVAYELLGVEHLSYFKNAFDVVFLMGILYHHPSPIDLLRGVRESLRKGGVLIVETQGIPGDQQIALFPASRYAKVPGTYFVPTVSCLENFFRRSGFREVSIFYTHAMSSVEQRSTEWMPYESYSNFIDEKNSSLTVEGYPAPIRIYARCEL